MTDPRHATPEWKQYKYLRDMAKTVESAGDTVGANDYDLSNLLWKAASRLYQYAEGSNPLAEG